MIGVISNETEARAVQEFFELYKTPWEFYLPQQDYDVLVVTAEEIPSDVRAKLVILYNSKNTSFDVHHGIALRPLPAREWAELDGGGFPLYGDVSTIQAKGLPFLQRRGTPEPIGVALDGDGSLTVRIGYNLFQEVGFLLSGGQPPENAAIPTLELHIAVLRQIMIRADLSFVEIPPAPSGFEFMACLTHDVDFTGIREHKFDYTIWGFLYRALFSSSFDALRGRIPWSRCRKNWKAVLSLPFVYLGWIEDFWLEFDRYMEIEKGLGSTFFFIPFRNYPGTLRSGPAPKRRAIKYDLLAMKEQVRKLIEKGCEVGLHGLDAWQSSDKARTELARIHEVTGQAEAGVRMHWLYYGEESPEALEGAGLAYDSTLGYNDAIGFRAGTLQAFCPLQAQEILELPLIIQDTAMLYPGRMHLTEAEALDMCKQVTKCAAQSGGAVTVNWHTRSLSPERLWGEFYAKLLQELRKHRVWFGTAREIVTWFRNRRAVRFEQVQFEGDKLHLKIAGPPTAARPPVVLRIYRSKGNTSPGSACASLVSSYTEIPWKGESELTIAS